MSILSLVLLSSPLIMICARHTVFLFLFSSSTWENFLLYEVTTMSIVFDALAWLI
jgi:hypothetical protein